MPLPQESQPKRQPTPEEMTNRLQGLLGKQRSLELVVAPDEENQTLHLAQVSVAPWRKTRDGWRVGKHFIVDYKQKALVMDGTDFESIKVITTRTTAEYETRVFGKPEVYGNKSVEGIIVPTSPQEITEALFTLFEHAKPKTAVEDKETKGKEEEPKTLYGKFNLEKKRFFEASRGHIYQLANYTVTSVQCGTDVLRVYEDQATQKGVFFDIDLPKYPTNDVQTKYYAISPNNPLQHFILMQGEEEPKKIGYRPANPLESDHALSLLQSLSTNEIKEQLTRRKTAMTKADDILKTHGDSSEFHERVTARFSDREPQVVITKLSKGTISILLEPFLSTDGLRKKFAIQKNLPIKIVKHRADDQNAPEISEAASPDEVSELLQLLNELS